MTLQTIVEIPALDAFRLSLFSAGRKLAFVPTMGALHEGHVSLVRQAKQHADAVICSIFVNPSQFGPGEDFNRYPRTLTEDVAKLATAGCDAVFLPNVATMYPEKFQTWVRNEALENDLCGAARPGHFRGVLTVVLKLLNIVRPEFALFGKKDYQQWRLIEKMALDLNLPVRIIGGETVREPDGLAMSSRNRYLKPEERPVAAVISKGLRAAVEKYKSGERNPKALIELVAREISGHPAIKIEYLTIRDQLSLAEFPGVMTGPAVILVAARLGDLRLIDNMELDPSV
ncbi:pantoate--beta-alanine ligase [bacterium]|nr:pantoate--beta-alanine ligase [bacterium]